MMIDPKTFKAPFIDNHACWDAADKFREHYWPSGNIPVDVLAIAEFDLELEILKKEFDIVLNQAAEGGMPRDRLTDAHLSYLCNPLSKSFAVSTDVIEKRLNQERLWPL